MIVITLTSCPPALRGDLTSWLQEIDTGVFIGHVNARVRDELWKRIQVHAKTGRATMVFSTNTEQRMDFRVHNASWEPIDFDGLKLMLRPNLDRSLSVHTNVPLPSGFSNAAKMHMARQMAGRVRGKSNLPSHYALVDVETTGLDLHQDRIIEIAAIEVDEGKLIRNYQSLVTLDWQLPDAIEKLTGISNAALCHDGKALEIVVQEFLGFVGNLPIVSHNVSFDYNFLRAACACCGFPLFSNPCTDTLTLAKRLVKDVRNYKLTTLAEHFDIQIQESHRSKSDCLTTKGVYEKLIEILETSE